MIKSQFSDPRFVDHGFWKHIHHVLKDLGVYPGTLEPLFEAYQIVMVDNLASIGDKGGKPRNLALFRKVLAPHADPSSGVWNLLHMWEEGTIEGYDDSSAAGSVDVNETTGEVHVAMSFGKKNASGVVVFNEWETTIPRGAFGPAIVRPPSSSAAYDDTALKARISVLEAELVDQQKQITQLETQMANIGDSGGDLSPEDAEALNWLKQYRAALHSA